MRFPYLCRVFPEDSESTIKFNQNQLFIMSLKKEPWRTIIQLLVTILTSLTTTVSANASGLTNTLTGTI